MARKIKKNEQCELCRMRPSVYCIKRNDHTVNLCDGCYDLLIKESIDRPKQFYPKELYAFLKKSIYGQDKALKKVATGVYQHYYMSSKRMKANMLIMGPTGTGKTEIARQLTRFLDQPVLIEDTSIYTPAGYKGKDLDDMIQDLFDLCEQDKEKTENAIIILDEFDKVTTQVDHESKLHLATQQALLKILEGKKVSVRNIKERKIEYINTSRILFICMGSFSTNTDYRQINNIGFILHSNDSIKSHNDKLLMNGLIPELLGRFPYIIELEPLTKSRLYDLIMKSDISFLKEYSAMFYLQNMEIEWSEKTVRQLCEEAYKRQTGVRGVQQAIQEIIEDFIFEIDRYTETKKIKI